VAVIILKTIIAILFCQEEWSRKPEGVNSRFEIVRIAEFYFRHIVDSVHSCADVQKYLIDRIDA